MKIRVICQRILKWLHFIKADQNKAAKDGAVTDGKINLNCREKKI